MLTRRIIPCLDVNNGRVVKGVTFEQLRDAGDPVALAEVYNREGADELVFYDITASSDKRRIMLDVVEAVAEQVFIPLSVGGGVRTLADATDLRLAGAEKINVNTAAVERPALIAECAEAIGNQNIVLSMDIKAVDDTSQCPSGYEIVIHGGRTRTGKDALAWALEGERLGAGELVVNSIDADGTREGYSIELTRMLSEAVRIPVIASGGAGKPEHLYDVLTKGKADAALVASMVHYGDYRVSELKTYLHRRNIKMRMNW